MAGKDYPAATGTQTFAPGEGRVAHRPQARCLRARALVQRSPLCRRHVERNGTAVGSGGRVVLASSAKFETGRSIDAESRYGVALCDDRLTSTPHAGLPLTVNGLGNRLGWRLTPTVLGGHGFEVGLEAMRNQTVKDSTDYGVMLCGAIRWYRHRPMHGPTLRCGSRCGGRCRVPGTDDPAPLPAVRAACMTLPRAHAFLHCFAAYCFLYCRPEAARRSGTRSCKCAAGAAAQAPLGLKAGCTTAFTPRALERPGSGLTTPCGVLFSHPTHR